MYRQPVCITIPVLAEIRPLRGNLSRVEYPGGKVQCVNYVPGNVLNNVHTVIEESPATLALLCECYSNVLALVTNKCVGSPFCFGKGHTPRRRSFHSRLKMLQILKTTNGAVSKIESASRSWFSHK